MNVVSVANPKTSKSVEYGYLTGILHLRPNRFICADWSPGCRGGCLNTAGRGAMSPVQEARQRRTVMYMQERDKFTALLHEDIVKLKRRAEKKGLKLAIRLNGTSDIHWEIVWPEVFKQFPDVVFYDYTPSFVRMRDYIQGLFPDNYKLCYSLKEDNWRKAISILENWKGNVAVVFRNELPETWRGKQVIDGDAHDLRFLDPANVVVGLRAKGKAKKDTSGFVQEGA